MSVIQHGVFKNQNTAFCVHVTELLNSFLGKSSAKDDPRYVQCRRDGMEVGTNYRGAAVRKGDRGPTMLHMFLYFSVVSLFVDCTN